MRRRNTFNVKLLFKGGVYDPRETVGAFCDAADRAMEPLEGGAVAARDRARLAIGHLWRVKESLPLNRNADSSARRQFPYCGTYPL